MKTIGFLNYRAGIVMLFFMLLCCRNNVPVNKGSEPVRVKAVETGSEIMVFPVRTTGIIIPANEIRLSFKTGGIVKAIYADNGTTVSKGKLLASLDLSEIEAQVAQAINGYEKALRDYSRMKNLYNDSVVTLEQLQNTETALKVAEAGRNIATFNKEHSLIVAPENGIVLKRLVEQHEVVAPGYPVFIFGTTGSHWKIRAGLADKHFVRVAYGDTAVITLDAYPGEHFRATISQISEAANPMTGTYEIELDLFPSQKRLASGFMANLLIYPSRNEEHLRIPVEAIVEAEGNKGYVFTINDSSVVKRVGVQIDGVFEKWAIISSGLQANERIVTEGAAFLSDGDKVNVVE